jgi:phosphoribosylformylglycinamidine (FGAM) synthase-like enzyme
MSSEQEEFDSETVEIILGFWEKQTDNSDHPFMAEQFRKLQQQLAVANQTCTYTVYDRSIETECGHVRGLMAFKPPYCAFCGRRVVEIETDETDHRP